MYGMYTSKKIQDIASEACEAMDRIEDVLNGQLRREVGQIYHAVDLLTAINTDLRKEIILEKISSALLSEQLELNELNRLEEKLKALKESKIEAAVSAADRESLNSSSDNEDVIMCITPTEVQPQGIVDLGDSSDSDVEIIPTVEEVIVCDSDSDNTTDSDVEIQYAKKPKCTTDKPGFQQLKCGVCHYLCFSRVLVALKCGHIFCKICIRKVMTRKYKCPTCGMAFSKRNLTKVK